MSERRFLALVGSPRAESTSEKLARYLADGLAARGWQTSVIRLSTALRHEEPWDALEEQYRQADVIGLCTPLYVDALPGHTTSALERLVGVARAKEAGQFFSLLNCGFLEAEQNDTAIAISRMFARDAGLTWAGGLALGGGGAVSGQPLVSTNKMIAHIVNALDLTIASIDAGQGVSAEAQTLIRRRFCPRWLYVLLANFGMLKGAFDNHVLMKIHARPYAEP